MATSASPVRIVVPPGSIRVIRHNRTGEEFLSKGELLLLLARAELATTSPDAKAGFAMLRGQIEGLE